jgi:class 3 adenylate cyclase
VRTDLPASTVTLVFTDIEGSTKLLHDLGAEAYSDALAEHRRLLREAFGRHGGVEIDTQGDAFFYAFPDPREAVTAAEEGREALRPGAIHVRVGVHTDTPHLGPEGYVGQDVHLGARIGAAGHGGQVLLSEATSAAAGLADDVLHDLGEHRLKDFGQPVRILQLGEAFGRHGGVEIDTQGDAFFYAFPDPREAVPSASRLSRRSRTRTCRGRRARSWGGSGRPRRSSG